MTKPPTPELIRQALQHIPANIPRDEWARVGMAIKSEYPDDTGRDLFTDWSATADGFNQKDAHDTWRNIKAGGGVGIGTLLYVAKENGFTLPKVGQPQSKPDPQAAARIARERAAAQQAEKARQDAAHQAAASEAVALWESAAEVLDPSAAPYLLRKRVQPYGVRFGAGGWLLVPVRDAAGELWNVQRIAPEKPTSGPDKLFLKGGRKSGLLHLCGDPVGAAAVLVAEGYATAASLHEATGRPVAVAFDAGNLAHVAKALHQKYPAALVVLCGDDDVLTFVQKGHNPGRDKATAAAKAVQGIAVFPEQLPEGGSDFNDMHQAAGLDAVRALVDSVIEAHQAQQTALQATQKPKAGQRTQRQQNERTEPQSAAGFERFHVADGDGLYFTPPGDDGGAPRRVCGVLRVVGMARDNHDNQAALLLEFVTQFGKVRRWLMPLAMLAGDGNAYRTALLGLGFMTPTDGKRRAWLTEYLQSRNPEALELVRHVPRVGWAGRCYVLPDETLGTSASGERIMFHSESGIEANFSKRGDLEQWRKDLARLCVGNSRAAFAVAASFAGPMLALAEGMKGGGIHYVGASSIGKTTCFLLAASVWGRAAEGASDCYIQKWQATRTGMEYLAEQHSDCTLILDELGTGQASDIAMSAYMLADGQGKNRGKAAGGLRPKPTWRLLYLSSGEITLANQLEEIGQKEKAGQEVRLIPLPAAVAEGTALETFHEFDSGHKIADWVTSKAARCYGVAGRAWLEHLVNDTKTLTAELRTRMDAIEAQIVPANAAGQVKRGGRRFALIAAAGEMATAAGITGWPADEAINAAQICFDAWIKLRGGAGNSEKTNMLRAVRSFLETHGDGRFAMWHRAADDHAPKTLQRAGVRRMLNEDGEPIKTNSQHAVEFGDRMPAAVGEAVSFEYFVLSETFKAEVCKGYDVQAVCAVLVEHGCLTVKEPGRYSIKTKLPGIGPARCYLVTPAIFDLDV